MHIMFVIIHIVSHLCIIIICIHIRCIYSYHTFIKSYQMGKQTNKPNINITGQGGPQASSAHKPSEGVRHPQNEIKSFFK